MVQLCLTQSDCPSRASIGSGLVFPSPNGLDLVLNSFDLAFQPFIVAIGCFGDLIGICLVSFCSALIYLGMIGEFFYYSDLFLYASSFVSRFVFYLYRRTLLALQFLDVF